MPERIKLMCPTCTQIFNRLVGPDAYKPCRGCNVRPVEFDPDARQRELASGYKREASGKIRVPTRVSPLGEFADFAEFDTEEAAESWDATRYRPDLAARRGSRGSSQAHMYRRIGDQGL